jgi:transposase
VQHRSEQAQVDLTQVHSRQQLIGTRTRLVNYVRGVLKSFGLRPPRCEAGCFYKRARAAIPPQLNDALKPVVDALSFLETLIRTCDRKLTQLADERYGETTLMRQVDRVGPATSLAMRLVLDDPRRFKRSRAVGAYVGLAPRQYESGKSRAQLSITKAGDKMLRSLLVQCAQQILGRHGKDCDLKTYGQTICKRGGKNAKKRAVVAVARKLAILLHRLWVSGEVYDPLRNAKRIAAAAA